MRTWSNDIPRASQLCFKCSKTPWELMSKQHLLSPPLYPSGWLFCNMTHISLRARLQFQQIKPSMTSKKKKSDESKTGQSQQRTETRSSNCSPEQDTRVWLNSYYVTTVTEIKSEIKTQEFFFFFYTCMTSAFLSGWAETRNNKPSHSLAWMLVEVNHQPIIAPWKQWYPTGTKCNTVKPSSHNKTKHYCVAVL